MKHKRCIKMLMSMGVQRNDAAGFAKAYNEILRKGLQDKFPYLAETLIPKVPQIRSTPLRTLELQAEYVMTDYEAQCALYRAVDFENYIRSRLGARLVDELLNRNAMLIRKEERRGQFREIRYSATVTLVLPRKCDELS